MKTAKLQKDEELRKKWRRPLSPDTHEFEPAYEAAGLQESLNRRDHHCERARIAAKETWKHEKKNPK